MSVESIEGVDQSSVALLGGVEKAVVGSALLGFLPDPFDRVEFWGIGWQPVKFDAVVIVSEPGFAVGIEVMARTVVDDKEDFTAAVAHQLLEETKEGGAVENRREQVPQPRAWLQGQGAKDMGGLAQSEGVHARLNAYA